jgi:hypothetical protein
LEPLLFAVPGLGFAARWLLQQAGGQLAGHEVQCRKTIDQILTPLLYFAISGVDVILLGPLHPLSERARLSCSFLS